MDKVSKTIRSKTMSAIRSTDTKMEVEFRKALFAQGIRFRKNVSSLLGKPDVAVQNRKIVIFLDSCFWHACPWHFRKPMSNRKYWNKKIAYNKRRAREVNMYYHKKGWTVLRFWEHQIDNDLKKCVKKASLEIKRR